MAPCMHDHTAHTVTMAVCCRDQREGRWGASSMGWRRVDGGRCCGEDWGRVLVKWAASGRRG